jgi:hypothetical protein
LRCGIAVSEGKKRRHVTQGSAVEPNPKHTRVGVGNKHTAARGVDYGAQAAEIEIVVVVVFCTGCGGVESLQGDQVYVLAARDKGSTK